MAACPSAAEIAQMQVELVVRLLSFLGVCMTAAAQPWWEGLAFTPEEFDCIATEQFWAQQFLDLVTDAEILKTHKLQTPKRTSIIRAPIAQHHGRAAEFHSGMRIDMPVSLLATLV